MLSSAAPSPCGCSAEEVDDDSCQASLGLGRPRHRSGRALRRRRVPRRAARRRPEPDRFPIGRSEGGAGGVGAAGFTGTPAASSAAIQRRSWAFVRASTATPLRTCERRIEAGDEDRSPALASACTVGGDVHRHRSGRRAGPSGRRSAVRCGRARSARTRRPAACSDDWTAGGRSRCPGSESRHR